MEKPLSWPDGVEWTGSLDDLDEDFVEKYCTQRTFESYDWEDASMYTRIYFKPEYGGPIKLTLQIDQNSPDPHCSVCDDDVTTFTQTEKEIEKVTRNPPCPRSREQYPWFNDGEPPCNTDPQNHVQPGTGKGKQKETGLVKRAYTCRTCGFQWNQTPPFVRTTPAAAVGHVHSTGGSMPPKLIQQKPVQQHEITPTGKDWISKLLNYPCMKCRNADPHSTVMAHECKQHKPQGDRKEYTCGYCKKIFQKEWIKGPKFGIDAHNCRGKNGMEGFKSEDDFIQWCNQEDAKHKQKLRCQQNGSIEAPNTPQPTTRKRKDPPELQPFTGIDVKKVRQLLTKSLSYHLSRNVWITQPVIPNPTCKMADEEGIVLPVFIKSKSFTKLGKTSRSPKGMSAMLGPIVEFNKQRRVIFARVYYRINNLVEKEIRILLQLRFDSEDNNSYVEPLDKQKDSDVLLGWEIFADRELSDVHEIRSVLKEIGF